MQDAAKIYAYIDTNVVVSSMFSLDGKFSLIFHQDLAPELPVGPPGFTGCRSGTASNVTRRHARVEFHVAD